MQCKYCDAVVDGEASFCDECGKPLREAALSARAVSSAPSILGLVDAPQPATARIQPKPIAATDSRPFARARFSRKWNSPEGALSHWSELLRGVDVSTMEFYRLVRAAIEHRRVPDMELALVAMHEGGIFSEKREYLRVIRKDYVFDVCGAPYGDGFFVSTWLGPRPQGLLQLMLSLPFIGYFLAWFYQKHLNPVTYYQADTASMFLTSVHNAVLEVVDHLMEARGLRGLTELQRKPINRNFFGQ